MTDVRDRAPEIELAADDLQVAPRHLPAPVRRTVIGRALSPFRRQEKSRELALVPTVDVREEPRSRARMLIVLSLIAVVLLPTVGAGLYLFAFATDQYVAETRFAVRKAKTPSGSDGVTSEGGGGMASAGAFMSNGPSLAGEDSEIIASYIHSRAAIQDVERQLDVRAIFRRPEADFWARLPADASREEMVRYWNKMVGVYVETSSGIVQVSVRAFRRADALALTKAILTVSEALANSLSVKMQADQTRLAEDEVRRSEGNVRFALADLTAFRDSQHLIDPVESSLSTGKLLVQLMSDKIETEGRLFVTQRSQGPDAPGISGTKARLESINKHIGELQDQMAGSKEASKNMAATMARFEELELKKVFAEKMFEFSRQALERARLAAIQQSIYLAVFLQPSLPQDYSYPLRFTDFFLVLLVASMTWISGAVVSASILDHRL